MKKGFTLLEILIVMMILGILVTAAVPAYKKSRETIADNQAKADLKLLSNAQKSYYFDMKQYYPSSGSQTSEVAINDNLGSLLLTNDTGDWDYLVYSTGCVQATSNKGTSRTWRLFVNDAEPEEEAAGCET